MSNTGHGATPDMLQGDFNQIKDVADRTVDLANKHLFDMQALFAELPAHKDEPTAIDDGTSTKPQSNQHGLPPNMIKAVLDTLSRTLEYLWRGPRRTDKEAVICIHYARSIVVIQQLARASGAGEEANVNLQLPMEVMAACAKGSEDSSDRGGKGSEAASGAGKADDGEEVPDAQAAGAATPQGSGEADVEREDQMVLGCKDKKKKKEKKSSGTEGEGLTKLKRQTGGVD